MAFMQHCHFKTLSLRQLTLYYIEMRKVIFIIVFVWGMMSLYAQSLKLNKHFEDSDKVSDIFILNKTIHTKTISTDSIVPPNIYPATAPATATSTPSSSCPLMPRRFGVWQKD